MSNHKFGLLTPGGRSGDAHWKREARDEEGNGLLWCGTFPCDDEKAYAVIEHAIACWNLCDGISTKDLQTFPTVAETHKILGSYAQAVNMLSVALKKAHEQMKKHDGESAGWHEANAAASAAVEFLCDEKTCVNDERNRT